MIVFIFNVPERQEVFVHDCFNRLRWWNLVLKLGFEEGNEFCWKPAHNFKASREIISSILQSVVFVALTVVCGPVKLS